MVLREQSVSLQKQEGKEVRLSKCVHLFTCSASIVTTTWPADFWAIKLFFISVCLARGKVIHTVKLVFAALANGFKWKTTKKKCFTRSVVCVSWLRQASFKLCSCGEHQLLHKCSVEDWCMQGVRVKNYQLSDHYFQTTYQPWVGVMENSIQLAGFSMWKNPPEVGDFPPGKFHWMLASFPLENSILILDSVQLCGVSSKKCVDFSSSTWEFSTSMCPGSGASTQPLSPWLWLQV